MKPSRHENRILYMIGDSRRLWTRRRAGACTPFPKKGRFPVKTTTSSARAIGGPPASLARGPLRDGVFDAIRDRVVTGGLAPGERVSIGPLSTELGVSPTPAREAFAQLERDGFLVAEPNRGFFVAPLTIEEAEGLYSMITLLETHVVREAGAISSGAISRMRETNRELEAHRSDPSRAVTLDAAWHLALISAANPLLIETVESLKRRAYRYEHAFMRASGQIVVSTDEHERITAMLETGDVARAAELVEAQWDRSLDFILPWLAEGGAE